jgi:hypothetical protein
MKANIKTAETRTSDAGRALARINNGMINLHSKMKKQVHLWLLLIPLFVQSQQYFFNSSPLNYAWKYVGNPDFSTGTVSNINLTFSPLTGEPFVSFTNEDYLDQASVHRFNGSAWVKVGQGYCSGYYTSYPCIAFSSTGDLYIAYVDYDYSQRVSVKKFNGTTWDYIGNPGFSQGNSTSLCLAVSPSGEPYVAFHDYSVAWQTSVMKFDGTNWNFVGSAGCIWAGAISLVFSPTEGLPYLAYSNYNNGGKAALKKFDGNSWVNVGGDGFSTGSSSFTSLAFDLFGRPYVAYSDVSVSSRVIVMIFDGSNWVILGNGPVSQGNAQNISIAVSSTTQPWVSYSDQVNSQKATVKVLEGTDWMISDVISPGETWETKIAITQNDQPYVAFKDQYHGGLITVMKYDSVFVGNKESQKPRLSFYPNPATTTLDINFPGTPGKSANLKIIDIKGMKMLECQVTESLVAIDVANYPIGLYFVKVTTDNSNYIGKFCKN